MHSEDHVFVGHARRVVGCAGVATSVDGEDLPDLQGACGGTGGQTSPVMEPAGLLPVPTPVSLVQATRPAARPFVSSVGEPGS